MILHVLACAALFAAQPVSAPPWEQPEASEAITQPRQAADADLKQIAAAKARLESDSGGVSALLADPALMPLHELTAFRELIRDHAKSHAVTIITAAEPGDRLTVTGTIRDAAGKPAAGALVYLYQTSAKGWYSDRAAHISGNSGDFGHARLFGYLRTDDQGRYELKTIRPAGYPQSTLPQHIHVEVTAPGSRALNTEILFDDDPRLSSSERRSATRAGFIICPLTKDPDGSLRCTADLKLKDS